VLFVFQNNKVKSLGYFCFNNCVGVTSDDDELMIGWNMLGMIHEISVDVILMLITVWFKINRPVVYNTALLSYSNLLIK
jgi:hypothetical protein